MSRRLRVDIKVSDQNGISLQRYRVEIYHSGWKPSICSKTTGTQQSSLDLLFSGWPTYNLWHWNLRAKRVLMIGGLPDDVQMLGKPPYASPCLEPATFRDNWSILPAAKQILTDRQT